MGIHNLNNGDVKPLVAEILRNSDLSTTRVTTIADRLLVGTWTINKRLAKEGTSYGRLLHEARIEKFKKSYQEPTPVILRILGFAAPTYLSKWVRDTFDMNLYQYRETGGDKDRIFLDRVKSRA